MKDSKQNKMLKYSIRKKKLGVGSIAIASTLLITGIPTTINTNNNVAMAEDKVQTKIDEYRAMYKKIQELAEANYGYYKSIIGDATGAEMTNTFKKSDATEEELKEVLLEFSNYGLIYENGVQKMFKTVDEFKTELEKNYQDALEKAKKELTDKIEKADKVEKAVKDKYKDMVSKETNLSKVRKEISAEFEKEIAQSGRKELVEAIEKAKDEVNKTAYLKEKNKYIKQLENASSEDEIKNILEQVKKEAEKDKNTFEAVDKVRKQINNMKYLTSDQKSNYNLLLDNANEDTSKKLLAEADLENYKGLVNIMKPNIEKAKESIKVVDSLAKAPENDDYKVQHELWEENLKLAKGIIDIYEKDLSKNPKARPLENIEKLNLYIRDFINEAKIEEVTRKVAEYRMKYPNNPNIERYFNNNIKQTEGANHASQSGNDLDHYVKSEVINGLNQIEQIVKNIEKNREKKAKVLKEMDKLIEEVSKKPLSNDIVSELKNRRMQIQGIADDVEDLAEDILEYAKDEVKKYEEAYNSYKATLEKGKEDANNLIKKLPENNEKAKELSTKLKQKIAELDKATLSGEFDYKTFIPKTLESISAEVDKFLKDNDIKSVPITPLIPAIVESVEKEVSKINYTTQEIENPDLELGVRRVETEGVYGERTVTYKVRKQGDKILSKEIVSDEVTKVPMPKIIEVGTKQPEVKPMPKPEEPKQPEVKPMPKPEEPKQPEVKPMPKPEEPKQPEQPKQPEVKPMPKPEEPKQPEVKPMPKPEEPKQPEVKPMPKPEQPKQPEVKPMPKPEEPKQPEVKPMPKPEQPKQPEVKPMPKPEQPDSNKTDKKSMTDKKQSDKVAQAKDKKNMSTAKTEKKLSKTGINNNLASYIVGLLALLLASIIGMYRKFIK